MSNTSKQKRITRVRSRIYRESERLRLAVFKSSKYIYAQIIDDKKHHTMASAWGKSADEVGKKIAEKGLKVNIDTVVFDRGGNKYHGKIKSLAESARSAGLKF